MQASKLEHTVVVVAAILILSMLSLYTSIIEHLSITYQYAFDSAKVTRLDNDQQLCPFFFWSLHIINKMVERGCWKLAMAYRSIIQNGIHQFSIGNERTWYITLLRQLYQNISLE